MQRSRIPPHSGAARAAQEAARLTAARGMLARAASASDVRPIACRVRRPHRAGAVVTAWRTTFADAADRVVWEQVCGVSAPLINVASAHQVLAAHAEDSRKALRLDMRRARERLLGREHAIVAAMRHRQARLAADLLQPGLFDARTTRAAAARSTVLQEALARSEARIRALERAESLRVDEQTLLFAIAFR
jgi:hypothetical protein